MSTTPKDLRSKNLRMLAALAALFVLPLLLAFYMYYGTDWRPLKRVNHGTLISPVRPLVVTSLKREPLTDPDPNAPPSSAEPAESKLFRDKWSIVYIGEGNCDERCRQALYVMRQTRLSLNNEMSRVERVFHRAAARLGWVRLPSLAFGGRTIRGVRRAGLDRALLVVRVAVEQRIALQFRLHIGNEVQIRQLQQLDRLHQLRRHHQSLALAYLESLSEGHPAGYLVQFLLRPCTASRTHCLQPISNRV